MSEDPSSGDYSADGFIDFSSIGQPVSVTVRKEEWEKLAGSEATKSKTRRSGMNKRSEGYKNRAERKERVREADAASSADQAPQPMMLGAVVPSLPPGLFRVAPAIQEPVRVDGDLAAAMKRLTLEKSGIRDPSAEH